MAEGYAIDLRGFTDLTRAVAARLDELSRAVDAVFATLREIGDVVQPARELRSAVGETGDLWRDRTRAAVQHGGTVLVAVHRAVEEYCRADAEMALSVAALDTAAAAGERLPR